MRIVYMGSPDFAVKPLEALIEAGHDVAAVITQPDRPKGRGGKVNTYAVSAKEVNQDLIDTVTEAFFPGEKFYHRYSYDFCNSRRDRWCKIVF